MDTTANRRATDARPLFDPAKPETFARAPWLAYALSCAGAVEKVVAQPGADSLADEFDRAVLRLAFSDRSMDPEVERIAWELARTTEVSNKNGESRALADKFLAALKPAILSPFDSVHWENASAAAVASGAIDLADATSRRAALLEPHRHAALTARAASLLAAGRQDVAEAYMVAAIYRSPPNSQAATDVIAICSLTTREDVSADDYAFERIARASAMVSVDKTAAAFVKGIAWSGKHELVAPFLKILNRAEPYDASDADGIDEFDPDAADGPPVILISQVQRSGGTLLSQLFDGHPEILAYPYELLIGSPEKWDWPSAGPSDDAIDDLAKLLAPRIFKLVRRGYSKGDGNIKAVKDVREFTLDFREFLDSFSRRHAGAKSRRALIGSYFLSFFEAWREYKPTGDERFISAFCPRTSFTPGSMARFFSDYPDGRLISCIRDPFSWRVSAASHNEEYSDFDASLQLWRQSTEAAMSLAKAYPEQVYLLTYDQLVIDTRGTMRGIADWLGIGFDQSLLVPTYAHQAVMANSSTTIESFGVHKVSLDAISKLSAGERRKIEAAAAPLFEEVKAYIESRSAIAAEAGGDSSPV